MATSGFAAATACSFSPEKGSTIGRTCAWSAMPVPFKTRVGMKGMPMAAARKREIMVVSE